MKNQYMDFVPAGASRAAKRQTVTGRTVTSGAAKSRPKSTPRATSATRAVSAAKSQSMPSKTRPKATRAASRPSSKQTRVSRPRQSTTSRTTATVKTTGVVGFSSESRPRLGQVENLNTRFVRSDVPKRPLSRGAHFTTARTGVAAAKARKVGNQARTPVKPVEKPVEKSKSNGVYQPPKSPFISQSGVAKRPLSKNVYAKKQAPATPTEAPQGPVTIISKPEKQAHVGMIITIILTIILGAAAGTAAFLLLPK